MNGLVIFTNNDSLKELVDQDILNDIMFSSSEDHMKEIANEGLLTCIAKDDLGFSSQLEMVENLIDDEELTICYIVLHETQQKKDLADWEESIPEAKVISRSHLRREGEFYFSVLPVLAKGELTVEHILMYFEEDMLKNRLHDLRSQWDETDWSDKEKIRGIVQQKNIINS